MEIDFKEVATYAIILIIVLIAAHHLIVVVSGSMEPAFYRGDIVLIQKADFFGIHEFDPTTVEVDNNNRPDPYYVKADQIQEKVVTLGDNLAVIPKIGYLSIWLRGL